MMLNIHRLVQEMVQEQIKKKVILLALTVCFFNCSNIKKNKEKSQFLKQAFVIYNKKYNSELSNKYFIVENGIDFDFNNYEKRIFGTNNTYPQKVKDSVLNKLGWSNKHFETVKSEISDSTNLTKVNTTSLNLKSKKIVVISPIHKNMFFVEVWFLSKTISHNQIANVKLDLIENYVSLVFLTKNNEVYDAFVESFGVGSGIALPIKMEPLLDIND